MKIEEKTALNLYHVDDKPHIEVNKEICRQCPHRRCTYVCPVKNYTLEGEEICFSHEACVECGACRIACDQGAITWDYPRGGFGISYIVG